MHSFTRLGDWRSQSDFSFEGLGFKRRRRVRFRRQPPCRSKWNAHTSSTAFRRVSSDTSQYSAVVPIWRWPISFHRESS
jgi:hypothetical protein